MTKFEHMEFFGSARAKRGAPRSALKRYPLRHTRRDIPVNGFPGEGSQQIQIHQRYRVRDIVHEILESDLYPVRAATPALKEAWDSLATRIRALRPVSGA